MQNGACSDKQHVSSKHARQCMSKKVFSKQTSSSISYKKVNSIEKKKSCFSSSGILIFVLNICLRNVTYFVAWIWHFWSELKILWWFHTYVALCLVVNTFLKYNSFIHFIFSRVKTSLTISISIYLGVNSSIFIALILSH